MAAGSATGKHVTESWQQRDAIETLAIRTDEVGSRGRRIRRRDRAASVGPIGLGQIAIKLHLVGTARDGYPTEGEATAAVR